MESPNRRATEPQTGQQRQLSTIDSTANGVGWRQSLPAPGIASRAQFLVLEEHSAMSAYAKDGAMEREVEIAELETRMRKYNLDLLQPTIRKATATEQGVNSLRGDVESTQAKLADLITINAKVEAHGQLVDDFRADMSKCEFKRMKAHEEVNESVLNLSTDISSLRGVVERESAHSRQLQRTVDRVVDELRKVHELVSTTNGRFDDKLMQQGRMLSNQKTDLGVKIVELESRLNRLCDELWGESTGLTQLNREVTRVVKLVEASTKEVDRLESTKTNVGSVEALQEEVRSLFRDNDANVSVLQTTLDTMVADVKSHFATATNVMAAHSATMLSQAHIADLETRLHQTFERTQSNVVKVQYDIDDMNSTRRRELSNQELQFTTMHGQVHFAAEASQAVGKCLEHLSSVLQLMLESERAASALDIQDDTDRAKIALMGYKASGNCTPSTSAPSRPPSALSRPSSSRPGSRPSSRGAGTARATPTPPLPTMRSRSAGGETGALDDFQAPPFTLDQRCLGCNGCKETVLAGFKMACINYEPGPVSFAARTYARPELLDLRERLLAQADAALRRGPFTTPAHRSHGAKKDPAIRGGDGAHAVTDEDANTEYSVRTANSKEAELPANNARLVVRGKSPA